MFLFAQIIFGDDTVEQVQPYQGVVDILAQQVTDLVEPVQQGVAVDEQGLRGLDQIAVAVQLLTQGLQQYVQVIAVVFADLFFVLDFKEQAVQSQARIIDDVLGTVHFFPQ